METSFLEISKNNKLEIQNETIANQYKQKISGLKLKTIGVVFN